MYDLILINRPGYFQHSNVFEAGFSDFHLLIATQFKMGFLKKLTKIIAYCDYKNLTKVNSVKMMLTISPLINLT